MTCVQNLGHEQELFAMYIQLCCEMALRDSAVKIQIDFSYQIGSESSCSAILPILHNKYEIIQKWL